MRNQPINIFVRKVLIINAIVALIACLAFSIFQLYDWSLGYLLGFMTSCLTLIMHAHNVKKVGFSVNSPKKNAMFSTLLRLLVSALSLFIALIVSWIDILATFIGLIVIKIIVIVVSLAQGNNIKGGKVAS